MSRIDWSMQKGESINGPDWWFSIPFTHKYTKQPDKEIDMEDTTKKTGLRSHFSLCGRGYLIRSGASSRMSVAGYRLRWKRARRSVAPFHTANALPLSELRVIASRDSGVAISWVMRFRWTTESKPLQWREVTKIASLRSQWRVNKTSASRLWTHCILSLFAT